MRKQWVAAACVAAAAGCAPGQKASPGPESAMVVESTTVTRSVRSLGMGIGEPGPLSGFTPAIPPFGENGRCETIPTEGGRLVLLSFEHGPGGAERNVSVEYDSAGTVIVYADVRGDLHEQGGPLTSVSVHLAEGAAQAMNSSSQGRQLAMGAADAALDLGTPRAMIAQIERQCGGAAK
ncbi:MAG TPA: hypothetical protein VFJ82_19250 [Longimicrobium sp.]|nr:hypothetical protein [Longimicrobium sp.]